MRGTVLSSTVLVLAVALLPGCRDGDAAGDAGAATPQAAVVAWLAAVDREDYAGMAALAPPGLSADGRAELEADLAERFAGARRDDETPFTMARHEGDRTEARVHLRRGGEPWPVEIDLEEHGGRWYVVPPRDGEVRAF
jgi:hypothetical protein